LLIFRPSQSAKDGAVKKRRLLLFNLQSKFSNFKKLAGDYLAATHREGREAGGGGWSGGCYVVYYYYSFRGEGVAAHIPTPRQNPVREKSPISKDFLSLATLSKPLASGET